MSVDFEKRVKDSNIRVVERNQLPLPGMETKGYRRIAK